MIYIVGFYLLLVLSLVKKSIINDKIFMILSAGICFFLMAFRSSEVGTDSAMYLHLYDLETSGYSTLLSAKAPLFVSCLKLISIFFPDWNQIYFVFTACVVISVVWFAISCLNISCRKAILLYYLLFFLDSLNGTRTYIAAAFVFLSTILFMEKKILKKVFAILLLLSAVLIHNVAIVGIVILLIESLNLENSKTRRIIIIIIIAMGLLLNPAIDMFVRYFPVYSDTLQSVNDKVGASAVVFQVIFFVSTIVAWYCIKKKYDSLSIIRKKYFDNFAMIISTELILYFVGGRFWYIQRALIFFEMPIIVYFPVLSNLKNQYRSLYSIIVWIVAIFLFVYRIFRNLGNVSPYTFYWQ